MESNDMQQLENHLSRIEKLLEKIAACVDRLPADGDWANG